MKPSNPREKELTEVNFLDRRLLSVAIKLGDDLLTRLVGSDLPFLY